MYNLSVLNIVAVIKFYKDGCSLRQVSKMTGVSRKSIRNILVNSGVEISTRLDQGLLTSKLIQYNSTYFDIIDSHEKAYWAGFMMADGSLFSNKKVVNLTLANKDRYHVVKFASIFNTKLNNLELAARCDVNCAYLYNSLCKLGIKPRKTYFDDLSIFNYINDRYINSFILGFFDGDGSAYVDKRKEFLIVYFHGRKAFLEKIKQILLCNLIINNNKIGPTKSIYRIGWSGQQAMKIMGWLYKDSPVKLERKYNIYKKYLNK